MLCDNNIEYNVYTVVMTNIQYTIRNIPPATDKVLKKRAAQTGKSFNQVVVETLNKQVFGSTEPVVAEVFGWLYGAGKESLGTEFDNAISDLSKPDSNLWK